MPTENNATVPDLEEAPYVTPPAPSDAIIEDWFRETFYNRGLDTALHNHIRHQVDLLKSRISGRKG